jgi:hypothetical protein
MGQQTQGPKAQGGAGLGDGVAPGGGARAVRLQVLEDLAVAVLGEQPQADDHPGDQPEGQARAVAVGMPRLPEDLLNDRQGDDTFEGADALVGGPLL